MKQYELTLEGFDTVLMYAHDGPRPDVVLLGSTILRAYKFYRFTAPKVPGRTACLYRLAVMAHYPLLSVQKGDK